MANGVNIKKLESDLWESADLLRSGSKLTSNQYCMPVLGLIFLRYAYSRFKKVAAEIQKDRPVRGGRVLPVEASDFAEQSALYLPREAQYSYLVNLPANISAQNLTSAAGQKINSLGEVVKAPIAAVVIRNAGHIAQFISTFYVPKQKPAVSTVFCMSCHKTSHTILY
ncbi:MAG: type I restriction-modification system subunit M N-terminal domain-containing protein [Lachnospiraceae bacterium]|nr:type I restriction-modification system subunit M N-terminal domain-containing protein [Lachnospiraceae bacterium]